MKTENINRVLILGGGTMGQQIAVQFALHGFETVVYDIKQELLSKAKAGIERLSRVLAGRMEFEAEQINAALSGIRLTTVAPEAAEGVDLISESVPEDPVLKGQVLAMFHELCPPHTIFTTNTSTLLPSMFANASGRPEKLAALHFHDLRVSAIVDIMPHPGTSPETLEVIKNFAQRAGLISIVMKKESPGYVFNAMLMAWCKAAQTLAANGIADPHDIDRAWMGVLGTYIGPFGIMDSIGLDTILTVTEFWAAKQKDPQQKNNAEFIKQYVESGKLGEKAQQGFYTYPHPEYIHPEFITKGFQRSE